MNELSRRELLSTLIGRPTRSGGKKWWADAGDRSTATEIGLTAATKPIAATSSSSDVLVVVLLYGGFDGLTALPPLGDPNYAKARPTIAVPASSAVKLDSMFALHPSMAPLKKWWTSKKLAVVPAAGIPYPTLSHFQAQQDLGLAAPGTALESGWMNRALSAMGDSDALAAVQVGNSVLTASMAGPKPVTTLWEVGDFSLVGEEWAPKLPSTLKSLYSSVSSTTSAIALDTLSACSDLADLQGVTYRPANGASYPDSDLGDAIEGVAQLIKAGVGTRLATVEYGDWDFHANLGNAGGGAMASMLSDLAGSLDAFATDLGDDLSRVTVVTISEFGRRVAENGSSGADHGHGNAMFVLGGGVLGGKAYGRWPGLAPADLDGGNLAGTTDYRSVLGELLTKRCGISSLSTVFPGFTPDFLGVA